jgi:hypothetical protein
MKNPFLELKKILKLMCRVFPNTTIPQAQEA